MSVSDLSGVTATVITVSDSVSSGRNTDDSGPAAARILSEAGAEVLSTVVVPDDQSAIVKAIQEASARCGLIVTTGGTGVAPRDVTPEATTQVCDRMVPGLAEVMRRVSMEKTPYAMLSRATAGIVGSTLVVNLPGSPGAVVDCLGAVVGVLGHAVKLLQQAPTEHIQT